MANSLLIKSGQSCMIPKVYADKNSSRQLQHLQAKSYRLFSGRQTNSNLSMMLTIGETEKRRTRLPSIFATYQSFQVSFPMPKIVSPLENHQVFINFRGDQLRHNFVSHLVNAFKNHGINFFIDKKEQVGKDLRNLFVRIEESRIALVIFSTRYSESKWCLNELVKMKKRADEGKLEVIPIFYKVEPRDVRRPTSKSEFGRNFLMLTEALDWRIDPSHEWREALECISNKMGLCLREKSSEADFVEQIVKEVERVNKAIGLEKV